MARGASPERIRATLDANPALDDGVVLANYTVDSDDMSEADYPSSEEDSSDEDYEEEEEEEEEEDDDDNELMNLMDAAPAVADLDDQLAQIHLLQQQAAQVLQDNMPNDQDEYLAGVLAEAAALQRAHFG